MILVVTIVLIVCVAFYFLPAFIALFRGHSYKWVILAINLAAGWTAIGWLAALVWAVWPSEKSLIDPVVGNVSGRGYRNTGDAIGAVRHGIERGQIEEARRAPVPARGAVSVDHIGQLERLAALQSAGALTRDEFLAEKDRLLRS